MTVELHAALRDLASGGDFSHHLQERGDREGDYPGREGEDSEAFALVADGLGPPVSRGRRAADRVASKPAAGGALHSGGELARCGRALDKPDARLPERRDRCREWHPGPQLHADVPGRHTF
jgi:hypothetical protein